MPALVLLDGPPAGDHRCRPEQRQQGVNCHQDPANCCQGCGRVDQEQTKPSARVDLAGEETEQDKAENGSDDRRKEAHAEGGITPQFGPQELGIGDERGFAVVGKSQVLRPKPLIGLVTG